MFRTLLFSSEGKATELYWPLSTILQVLWRSSTPPNSSLFSAAHWHRKYAGSHQHSETGESEATPSGSPFWIVRMLETPSSPFFSTKKLGAESCLSITWHCNGGTGGSMWEIVPWCVWLCTCLACRSLLTGFWISHREISPCIVVKLVSPWEEVGSGASYSAILLLSFWAPLFSVSLDSWKTLNFEIILPESESYFAFQFINKWLDFSEFQCPTL